MAALIVGGDYVEPLKREIRAGGHERVEHWDGRKPGFARRVIPGDTRLIVVLCDYVSHGLLRALRRQAGKRNVPVLYCRRSAHELRSKLQPGREGGPSASTEPARAVVPVIPCAAVALRHSGYVW